VTVVVVEPDALVNVKAGSLELRFTGIAAAATPFSVKVPTEVVPPATVSGENVNVARSAGVSVRICVTPTPNSEAVI
jgi:hypothetical protein